MANFPVRHPRDLSVADELAVERASSLDVVAGHALDRGRCVAAVRVPNEDVGRIGHRAAALQRTVKKIGVFGRPDGLALAEGRIERADRLEDLASERHVAAAHHRHHLVDRGDPLRSVVDADGDGAIAGIGELDPAAEDRQVGMPGEFGDDGTRPVRPDEAVVVGERDDRMQGLGDAAVSRVRQPRSGLVGVDERQVAGKSVDDRFRVVRGGVVDDDQLPVELGFAMCLAHVAKAPSELSCAIARADDDADHVPFVLRDLGRVVALNAPPSGDSTAVFAYRPCRAACRAASCSSGESARPFPAGWSAGNARRRRAKPRGTFVRAACVPWRRAAVSESRRARPTSLRGTRRSWIAIRECRRRCTWGHRRSGCCARPGRA